MSFLRWGVSKGVLKVPFRVIFLILSIAFMYSEHLDLIPNWDLFLHPPQQRWLLTGSLSKAHWLHHCHLEPLARTVGCAERGPREPEPRHSNDLWLPCRGWPRHFGSMEWKEAGFTHAKIQANNPRHPTKDSKCLCLIFTYKPFSGNGLDLEIE